MKTFLKVVAWLGLVVVFLGTTLNIMTTVGYMIHPPGPYGGGVDFGHAFAIYIYYFGLPFMLIGGLISRPKLFWLFSIIIGSLFFMASILLIIDQISIIRHTSWDFLLEHGEAFPRITGLIAFVIIAGIGIIEGILIRWIDARKNSRLKNTGDKAGID